MIDALQILVGEMGTRGLRHLGQLHLGQLLQVRQEPEHDGTRQTVEHLLALFAIGHEVGGQEDPQVLAGVGHRQSGRGGQRLDRPFALCQQVEQDDTLWTGDGLPDASELRCYALLHNYSIQVYNRIQVIIAFPV